MEDSIGIRLKLFLDASGLTSTQFADMCGIPRPSFSQILSGRNKKVSDVVLRLIHRGFPSLSMNWLLFGEGPAKVVSETREGKTVGQSSPVPANIGEEIFDSSPFHVEEAENEAGFSSENSPLPTYGKKPQNYPVHNALTSTENTTNSADGKDFTQEIRIQDLRQQIENMRKKPRKVTQITVYYDDSTFETFVPK